VESFIVDGPDEEKIQDQRRDFGHQQLLPERHLNNSIHSSVLNEDLSHSKKLGF
jgi:hypothetical protein